MASKSAQPRVLPTTFAFRLCQSLEKISQLEQAALAGPYDLAAKELPIFLGGAFDTEPMTAGVASAIALRASGDFSKDASVSNLGFGAVVGPRDIVSPEEGYVPFEVVPNPFAQALYIGMFSETSMGGELPHLLGYRACLLQEEAARVGRRTKWLHRGGPEVLE